MYVFDALTGLPVHASAYKDGSTSGLDLSFIPADVGGIPSRKGEIVPTVVIFDDEETSETERLPLP
jgi:hypothetical protein